MLQELLNDCKITRVSSGAAAGVTEVDSTLVDMSGYSGVMFLASLSTVVDASVLTLTAKENTANSTSGWTAVSGGATAPFTASTSSNTDLAVDCPRPSKRYVGVALTRTAQNATVGPIYAIQYRSQVKPVTNSLLATAIANAEV